MTAARLSPAASLLRNSKLFAIPQAIPLPPAPASSDEVYRSDTATTQYPTRAALETPTTSLNKGDWGLKRALPLKSTTKSGTPTIRIQGGIDTAEHIADFESAADHVLTLKKFQELDLQIKLPWGNRAKTEEAEVVSPFNQKYDNILATHRTANQSLPSSSQTPALSSWRSPPPEHLKKSLDEFNRAREAEATANGLTVPPAAETPRPNIQERRRWRYSGPWLAGMTGMEFDTFLDGISQSQKSAFRASVTAHLATKRQEQRKREALETGGMEEQTNTPMEPPTEQEVTEYMRVLRSRPEEFGPLIAEFLDLPDGDPVGGAASTQGKQWSYGRDTTATDTYKKQGPPRTHPSAGLSYIHNPRFVRNHPDFGPRERIDPIPARLLKTTNYGAAAKPYIGVAGFVVPKPVPTGTIMPPYEFRPVPGGPKRSVVPTKVNVRPDGKIEMFVKDYTVESRAERASRVSAPSFGRRTSRTDTNPPSRNPLRGSPPAQKPDEDVSDLLGEMQRAFGGTTRK